MGFLSRFTGAGQLTPAAAAAGAADGTLVLVDVRETGEFTAGHAPQARHMPLGQLAAGLDGLRDEGRPVAFVCHSGARSARATRQARAAGIDARNVRGGMAAWGRAGLPTATGDGGPRRRGRRDPPSR
ncbi:rhodanese-like domain-containing protein [Paraconexibacter antarcticus]|uniref:Rhodanese-like domain-containing protein n=1 Tax=Paraconexibacter antarcticus TaxID=2949664 RepID=A0ABY5DM48_9ACTN|nr:rhodanese-like domain-containing protein [Paraconexibacter antarcticus]UTI63023.1 rhodanese-like domain-containing protein [Paraconexibacter antarcticus]